MTLAAGTQLGRYEIRSKIGEGGMGEVYRAWDTELERDVALKVLPADLVENADRVQRFVREAKAASALNHPYILTVHEIGRARPEDGRGEEGREIHYIAAEFVDGVSLRAKIYDEKIDPGKSLRYLTQVADGLAKAHAAGIVHRDLKPDNVMITRDDFAKILDFGLAKLVEGQRTQSADGGSEAATAVLPPQLSQPGVIMGTAGYMSPEQAQGRAVDHRSDIFSFGCLLYEAATGRQPFAGDSVVDTLHKIIYAQPAPVTDFNPAAPAELQRIIRKCLAKDAEERYQTVKDVALDLKVLRRELGEAPAASSSGGSAITTAGRESRPHDPSAASTVEAAEARPTTSAEYLVREVKRHKLGALAVLSLLVVAALGVAFGAYRFLNRGEDRPAAARQMKVTRLTSTGKVTRAAVSPDGKYAIHVVDEAGRQGLWIRQIATASNVNILPPAEVNYLGLTFSRDGNYVYYVRREQAGGRGIVYQMPALGGSSRKITEGADGAITLSPDGKQFAFVRYDFDRGESALMVADMDGRGEHPLATRKEPEGFEGDGLAWSPDGKVIACSGYGGGRDEAVALFEVSVEGGRERQIFPQRFGSILKIAWLGDGSGLVMSAADKSSGYFYQVWHVDYPKGSARRVTNDLNSYTDVSLSADSNTLLAVQGDWVSSLWVAPEGDAGRARRITSGKHDGAMGVAWTPDGRVVHASRDWDIWIVDADGQNQKLLTVDQHNNRWASVTPDGRYILFESWRQNSGGIWRMDIDGGNPRQLTEAGWCSVPRASPDSRWVVYECNASGKMTIWRMSVDGEQEQQLTDKITEEPAVSPDGKHVACFYYPGQNVKLAVIPFEGGDPVLEFDVEQGIRAKTPGWTPDGRAITYVLNREGVSNIWAQPLDGGKPRQLTDFKTDRIFAFDWSRDGRELLLARGTIINDVVLITEFR